VDVAFVDSRIGDAHELRFLVELGDVRAAGIPIAARKPPMI
jgi:hypothetical protein